MNHYPPLSVILLAGGTGKRMGSTLPKQFLPLGGKPIALHSFSFFASFPFVSEIIVVCDPAHEPLFPKSSQCTVLFARPGKERQDSVASGLEKVSSKNAFVAIHDSARPFVKEIDFPVLYDEARKHAGAVSAVRVKNTIKQSDAQECILQTISRENLWEIHTPQILNTALFKESLQLCKNKQIFVTDDASALEHAGHRVKLVSGSYHNIKITTQEDLVFSEYLLQKLS